jgi:hypothetical protein
MAQANERYRSHHYGKTSVAAFLNPVDGVRGAMRSKGIEPKNHARDNVLAFREKAAENRQRLAEEEQQQPEAWKLNKFRDVKSRIAEASEKFKAQGLQNRRPSGGGGVHSPRRPPPPCPDGEGGHGGGGFLRKGALDARLAEKQQTNSPRDWSPRRDPHAKPPVPRPTAVPLAPRQKHDFIAENKSAARTMDSPRKDSADEIHRHSSFGAVPLYIRERNEAWALAEARKRAAMPDPNCPAGMVLMREDERLGTLATLKENEAFVSTQLFKLPLRSTTPSLLKRKEELEQQLREIEDAKRLFSKSKVYVKA